MDEAPVFRMRRVLSIDEIAERCRREGIDCVVSVDAPLVTALNARHSNSLFGFAYTPLNIANSVSVSILGSSADTDLEICHRIMHITGATLRQAHSTLCRIRDIRRYTSDVESYLLTRREKEICEAFRQTRSLESVMERFGDRDADRFFDGRSVGVVDVELFSELDKRIPPVIREDISNASLDDVGTEWFSIDRIHSVGNDRQIAEAVADLISPENCGDAAIVLDSEGDIAEAVRSALYRKGIPFRNKLAVKDLAVIRDYIRFLNDALEFATIRAGDVRELFSAYGASGPGCLTSRYDRYLLSKIGAEILAGKGGEANSTTMGLIALMSRIRSGEETFLSVADGLPKVEGRSSIKILLRDMGIEDAVVTADIVGDIEYAVNNISDLKHNEQIPEDERRGVLIADCRNSTYIDRPLVFFIGLDEQWRQSPSGKDYIRDPLEFEEKEAMRLRILLQQGDRRLYIVRPATDGKETVPCSLFETMADMEGHPVRVSRFSDICGEVVSGTWRGAAAPASPETGAGRGAAPVDRVVFSKTEYNKWRDCPVKFALSRVLRNDDPESDSMLFGTYVHEFAEFAFCHPELAKDNFDTYMERLLGLYSGISNSCMAEFDRSRFRTVMRNVLRYVASIRPAGLVLDGDNSERANPNILIAEDERTGNRYSRLAETFLPSSEGHPFFAKPDLTLHDAVIDYKTGAAKTAAEILDAFTDPKVPAEFQPPIYLDVFRESRGPELARRPVEFDLVYFGEKIAETVSSGDIGRCVRSVILVDELDYGVFEELGVADAVMEEIGDMGSYRKFTRDLPATEAALANVMGVPGWYMDDGGDEDRAAARLADLLGMSRSDRKTCRSLLNKFVKRGRLGFIDDRRVVIDSHLMDSIVSAIDGDSVEARDALSIPLYGHSREDPVCDYCGYRSVCMYRFAEDMGGREGSGGDSRWEPIRRRSSS